MRTDNLRKRLFLRNLWNGVLGISVEIILTASFILMGFFVCLIWWRIF